MMYEYICAVYACRMGLYRCHICRCVAYGYVVHILFSHFSTADPKNTSSGSAGTAPARSAPETQHVAVSADDDDTICCVPPLPRDRPPPPLKGALLIPCTWYTSGNSEIAEKSDQAGTGVR